MSNDRKIYDYEKKQPQYPGGTRPAENPGYTGDSLGTRRQTYYQTGPGSKTSYGQEQQPASPAPPDVDYNQQLDDLYSQIMNRPDFSFDLNADALYQQLRESYIANGQKAMMDTMGQAATLTGGYGNSYAQGVGQQAYQDYLQGLTDEIPDLYQMALSQYMAEGDALYDQLAALQWKAEFDEDQRRYNQAWEQEYGDPSGGGNGGSSGGTGGSGGDGGSGGNGGGNDDLYITDEELYAGMSEAGQAFLRNVPYLHAGGDVEGWKRTVAGMLYRALEKGTLTEEDAILITIQLGLEDIVPDDKDYTKPEEEKKNTGSTGGGGGGHRPEMKPWGP